MSIVKKIYCAECKKYLGEINKAKLRKNISHLCDNCESARKLMKAARSAKPKHPLDDILSGMFGWAERSA